ncbi:SpoIIE family protein phosphatase [Catalinimonas alkaloidigena]|uniref:SpoIIE family protein phosphatase n=1 Tax=Catalinimonas alkaloidigena TaxID=1075417 RepID=UPI00240559D4|nr:SpoIIE family protein phosphatase [Catalinimonas alkaloidigena]
MLPSPGSGQDQSLNESSGNTHLINPQNLVLEDSVKQSTSQSEEIGYKYLAQAQKLNQDGKLQDALSYALQALSKFEGSNNPSAKEATYYLLSDIYIQERVLAQALFYDQQLEKLLISGYGKKEKLLMLRFEMCLRFLEIENYEQAKLYGQKVLEGFGKSQSTEQLEKVNKSLLSIAQKEERYKDALVYAQWLQKEYANSKAYQKEISALNNLGFIYQRLDEKKKAVESFRQAITLSEQFKEKPSVILLINVGLAYSNLENDKQALQYYERALQIEKDNNNRKGEADINNYIASHYYLSGRQSDALKTALAASQVALEERAWFVLLDSYRLLKMIYRKEKRDDKVKEYGEKFDEIRSYITQQAQKEQDELEQRYQAAITREEEIKAYWGEKEESALMQERRETQLKLQTQELSLLKKEKELQSLALSKQILESNNAKQALDIANQKLKAEQQERQLEELAREKELQSLRIHRQKLEQEKQKQTIKLLETDRQLKEERLLKEANLRKYGYGILGLCLLIIGVIAFSFTQKSKDNKRLEQQKEEILNKNELLHSNEEELKQHMFYLEQTRELLADQKEQLMLVHNRVQESIEYAKQIQDSILPNDDYIKELFPESYLIFMPKDIVSGDFYWVSQQEDYQILIVADCTGHGVPGALITLIGHSLLTEAIQAHQMSDPGAILTFLHQKLLERLRYHESSRLHGMDIGICVIQKVGSEYNVCYAGAKNTLWIIKEGEVSKVKGNRISIGSSRQTASFDLHQLRMNKDDKIYLSSDGIIDQPNEERKRFGSAQLASCLKAWHHLPMESQKNFMLAAFADHQQGAEQRDDISLIGVRFQ